LKYLLDASALVPLVTKAGKRLLAWATHENMATTDLAVYEACNSLWKLATQLKTISLEDALDTAATIKDLIDRKIIQVVTFERLDLSRILRIANEEELTFYDSSYVVAAENTEAALVTEDKTLRRKASKYVKTITYTSFKRKLEQTK